MKKTNAIIALVVAELWAGSFNLGTATNSRSAESSHDPMVVRTGEIALSRSRSSETGFIGDLLRADTVTVQLFKDLTVTVKKDYFRTEIDGGIFWKGTLIAGEDGYLQLYYTNGMLSGRLHSSSTIYNLEAIAPEQIRVTELDPEKNPVPETCTVDETPHDESNYLNMIRTRAGEENEQQLIDILLLYPSSLVSKIGGAAAVDAKAKEIVAESNDIFINSKINVTFRLVHHEVNDEVPSAATNTDVLKSSTKIAALRDKYGADLVAHWNNGGTAGSGSNWSGSSSACWSTSNYADVISRFTFTHECGHNMGGKHDRHQYISENRSDELQKAPYYQFGICFPNYRSVMAYDNCAAYGGSGSCDRVPYFSNPDIIVNGKPFGVAGSFSSTDKMGPSNNAQRLNDCAPSVAKFKTAVVNPTTYALTVKSGIGSGNYLASAAVTIVADDSSKVNKVFTHWSGAKGVIDDSTKATAKIAMPAQALTVTANYKTNSVATYLLTVKSGSGSGSYAGGSVQTIVADDSSKVNKVFTHWSGAKGIIDDSTKATAKITMPTQALTVTAQYKQAALVDTSDLSKNFVIIGSWTGSCDTIGSTITVDSTAKSSGTLAASIKLVADNVAQYGEDGYSWGMLNSYVNGSYKNVNYLKLRYSSDDSVRVVFVDSIQKEKSCGYTLPATSGVSTVLLPMTLFTPPSWVAPADKKPLNLESVVSISLEAVAKNKTTNLKIEALQLNKFALADSVALARIVQTGNSAVSMKGNTVILNGISGIVRAELFSLNGRKLYETRKLVESGFGQLEIPQIGTGIHVLTISTETMQKSLKINLH